jgi:hypothetical protein
VGAVGCGEDLVEQQPQQFCVDPGQWVVRACQIDRSFDHRPLPVGTQHYGGAGMGPEVAEFAGPAAGDHANDRDTGDRMAEDAGAGDGCVSSAVGKGERDHGEPVIP